MTVIIEKRRPPEGYGGGNMRMEQFHRAKIIDGIIYLDGTPLVGVQGYSLEMNGGPLETDFPVLRVTLLLSGIEISRNQGGNNVTSD